MLWHIKEDARTQVAAQCVWAKASWMGMEPVHGSRHA